MPRSGPGRSRRLIASIKSRKNKNEKLLEHRKPSTLALEQSVNVEGNVPSEDVQPMIELSDKVNLFLW